mmetsp:Transcript_25144/g.30659  ORF Transcript_25144/g.30659 Transcript_25144/m.30659 type:complete len:361 (+) Transcript_25144:52-1134(+)
MESVVKLKTSSFKAAVLRSKYNRANSTSTVKVSSTMSKPDNAATIRAVSVRLRKYVIEGDQILASSNQCRSRSDLSQNPLAVFNDVSYVDDSSSGEEDEFDSEDERAEIQESKYNGNGISIPNETDENNANKENQNSDRIAYNPRLRAARPSVAMIAQYLNNMFITAQCSEECNIICLIYVDRILNCCKHRAQELGKPNCGINSDNWRGVLMTSMLLASKVWDDLSMVNEDFSIFMPYSLNQINAWEIHFLSCVGFNVRVSASEYAKYYFELRNDCQQWGEELPPMRELNMKQAAQLEILSSCMEQRAKDMHMQSIEQTPGGKTIGMGIMLRRTKSCADCAPDDEAHHVAGSSPARYVID